MSRFAHTTGGTVLVENMCWWGWKFWCNTWINVHIHKKQKNLEFVRHFCLDYLWCICSVNDLIKVAFLLYISTRNLCLIEKSIWDQPTLNFNIQTGFQFSLLTKPHTWTVEGTQGQRISFSAEDAVHKYNHIAWISDCFSVRCRRI